MSHTHTGDFPIGFRRGGSPWQHDLAMLTKFAKDHHFSGIDTGPEPVSELRKITDAGLSIGTVDLKDWPMLASHDAGKRKEGAARNADLVKHCATLGVKNFFVVVIPEDHARPRAENFRFAIDGYGQLAQAISSTGARLAIEGWPGGEPHYSSLACTTADYRAFLKDLPNNVGINYDPSHLIRVGIDHVRFLAEFAPRVYHVHGKDTELLEDELYEHGNLQTATFAKGHGWGGHHWRYTIPGHGCAHWGRIFSMLKAAHYQGMVSVELEDEHFNGTEEGEKRGLICSREYLRSV